MVPVLTTVDEMMGNDTGWNDYKHMLNQSMAMMEANMLFMEQMQGKICTYRNDDINFMSNTITSVFWRNDVDIITLSGANFTNRE